ncbi:MAG: FkbM family methyltransferase [Methylocella sp.]
MSNLRNTDANRLWDSLKARRNLLLSARAKKVIRSLQIFFPSLPDTKFLWQARYFRITRRLFKAEFGGLRKLSLRGRLLLDVGANRGQSIIAFQNAVPECQIVAFEPNRDLSACLATCYAGDASVKVEAVALASAPGHLTLYVPFYNGFSFDGLSSPRQDEAVRWFNSGRLY